MLLVLLPAALLFLRRKFPNPSRRSETVVLVSATILFFTLCNLSFSRHNQKAGAAGNINQVQAGLLKP